MNKKYTALTLLGFLSIGSTFYPAQNPIEQLYGKPDGTKKIGAARDIDEPIHFNFNNEELVDVINYMAAQKGVNVIMPMGADTITSRITLNIDYPLTVKEAWDMLYTILDVAGYSLIPKGTMYSIVKTTPNVSKEIIPLYVGMEPDKLPDTDQRIRYLYYLNNIKVTDDPNPANNELAKILSSLLPDTAKSLFDSKVNAVIITDKANNIKAAMTIIAALDQTTLQEKLEIIPLRYTPANTIAQLFTNDILKAASADAAKQRAKGKTAETAYFSDQVKILAEPRTNTLIVLGKAQAVNRVKDFIYKYLDVEMESGQSILHVYQLLYLDAASFEGVLTNIVKSELPGGTGQSAAGGKSGVERFFEGVIIKADVPKAGGKEMSLYGSNKLIIAARNEDWKYIKHLIEQLDKPQPQVIIEVLIADLTIDDLRALGSSIRNPAALPMGGTNFQSAQIAPVVTDGSTCTGTTIPPTTIAADLLGNVFNNPNGSGCVSAASLTGVGSAGFPGSTLLSFSDPTTGKTWGITQLLQLFNYTKILSNPHIIATNNQTATVSVGDQRLAPGETTATAAAPTIKQDTLPANLKVTIKPRISSADNVNLQVTIDITEFLNLDSNTRITRQIVTNAYVKSQDILALGGLIKTSAADSMSETPILGKIPILGWFFKRRSSENIKTNLTVFISPTIVQPRLRGGVNEYTKDYIKLTEKYVNEAQLFDSLRDPVTRFFFKTNPDVNDSVNQFIAQDELKHDPSLVFLSPEQEEEIELKRERQAINKKQRYQIMQAAQQEQPDRRHARATA